MRRPICSARKTPAQTTCVNAAPQATTSPARPSWQASSCHAASFRRRLLASCSGTTVLAAAVAVPLVLLSASVGGEARAQACDASYGGCSVITQGNDGVFPGKPGFDDNGTNGNPGGSTDSITLTLPSGGGTPFYGAGSGAGIQVITQGGSGSEGTNASDNSVGSLPNLDAGDGGGAGTAGSITQTIPQGAQVQAISSNGVNGSQASGAPAIWLYSQGGSGGGGGLPTEGGHVGLSQPGAAGGDITANILMDPGQVDQTTGATGGVVSAQTGILLQSIAGSGGSGNNHVTGYAKAGIDGATTDANSGATNGPGGHVQVTIGTSVTAFSPFSGGLPNARAGTPARLGDTPTLPSPPDPNGPGAGVWAISVGGNGGNGGTGSNDTIGAGGGNGGNASAGGQIDITVNPGASVTSMGGNASSPAIWAQSLGGIGGGGSGDKIGSGGNAGAGGAGGAINITNYGTLGTQGADNSPGVLAQSFGGAGANGGTGGGWGASGGEGATGGNGGSILIIAAAAAGSAITTTGSNSPGILAQSIGAGGGNGGDSTGWLAVGGSGAGGGDGGTITIWKSTNPYSTSNSPANLIGTSGERSAGILAQSIGGGGGNGGNAISTSDTNVFLNIAVGGSGAGGGNGGSVQAATTGSITTSGLHSSGMVLQSIGGGGGNGGAAYSKVVSVIGGASVSVGGTGGGGGDGGLVGQIVDGLATSAGQIVTTGANSHGILGQSIGGGGGIGGVSGATATVYGTPTEEVPTPTVSIAVTLGGSGGAGGSGSSVTLTNTGLIATAGGGSVGLAGLSVGGGGGSGGDASAMSTAKGGDDSPLNVSTSVALGGKGAGGGAGGPVTLTNDGMIFTRGEASDGILAQSIGGGGGNGGGGDARARSSGDGANISATISLGAAGGAGGTGGPITVANTGAMLTLGDGAIGILAQSVGGGGGRGGGAAGTSNGQFSSSVSLGGSGGKGGSTSQPNDANAVTVTNGGTIVTFGADAPAVVAQSIGGGGGMGGKSASTLGNRTNTGDGGNGAAGSVAGTTASLNAAFAAGGEGAVNQYNSVSGLIGVANSALGTITARRRLGLGDDADDLESLGESGGDSGDGSSSTKITVHVNVGGQGAMAGTGGNVGVTNTGSIGTVGPMSDGILAQSIGGGGGRGGAAVSSITSGQVNEKDQQGNVPISVGGRGGGGGNAGAVTVTNSGGVTTIGAQSLGIVAQSIAGGGGIAGTSAAKVQGSNAESTSVLSLPIAIGATGGGGGTTGTVTVNNSGAIVTRSHDAIGIVAQSIAGGGGIIRTRSSDAADNNGGGAVATGGSYGINLTFGGDTCGTQCDPNEATPVGTSGAVVVTHTGSITTSGDNAYGVLAQSIGGGGGVVLGGTPSGTNFFGASARWGHADQVSGVWVALGTNSTDPADAGQGSITTTGRGAVAVFAQSIGGGGGIAGDTGLTAQRAGFTPAPQNSGNGGPVLVQVNPTATLSTAADNTPVILAQSIGGGGGRITNNGFGAYDGSAGGWGTGGAMTVDVGGQVRASGSYSPGIFAESVGRPIPPDPTHNNPGNSTGGSSVQVNVLSGGVVQGGKAGDYGAGIYIVGGGTQQTTPNRIWNGGTITSADGTTGTAIYSTGGWTNVDNQTNGSITGSVSLDNGGGGGSCPFGGCSPTGGSVSNAAGGTINTGAVVRLGASGTLTNSGALNIGGTGQVATTAMTGTLVQTGTGRLIVDTDHHAGVSDRLDVQGVVRLGGTVEVHPASVANQPVTVLTATDGVTIDPGLTSTRTHLFGFDAVQAGNSVQVQPRAEFAVQAASLGANQRSVAGHLQQVWDSGADMTAGFTALNGIRDGGSYRASLSSLAGASVGGVVATRQAASERFSSNLINCEPYRGGGAPLREESCAWLRTGGTRVSLTSSGDAPGFRQASVISQVGGQVEVAPGWFVGASAGYETSWLRGDDDGSKVSGQSALFGLMLKRQTGPWTLTGAVDGGYGWYRSNRQIQVGSLSGQASGSPGVSHAGLHLRAAYQVGLGGDWYAKPSLTASAVYRGISGYSETGSTPFNLNVRGSSDVVGAASPMVELGRGGVLPGLGTLRGFVGVGAAFYANNDWKGRAGFQSVPASAGTFTATSRLPAAAAKLQAGLDLFTVRGVEAKLTYDAQLAPGYVAQSLIGRLAYAF